MTRNEHVIFDAPMRRDAVIQPVNEELVNDRARVSCSLTVRKVTCTFVMHFITCREEIMKRDLSVASRYFPFALLFPIAPVRERDEEMRELKL